MSREELETWFGKVWTTEEATKEFKFLGFQAPFVVVQRRDDNTKGSLVFEHKPRFYHTFVKD